MQTPMVRIQPGTGDALGLLAGIATDTATQLKITYDPFFGGVWTVRVGHYEAERLSTLQDCYYSILGQREALTGK